MPQIIPIKDLRDTNRISELCHETNAPIYITKNGYGDMVLMSMSSYENLVGRAIIHDAVIKASEQVDAGVFSDGVKKFAELEEKYGIQ